MATTNGVRPAVPPRTPMLPSDAFFWHVEKTMPDVRPYVAGLLMLDRHPDRACLRAAAGRPC